MPDKYSYLFARPTEENEENVMNVTGLRIPVDVRSQSSDVDTHSSTHKHWNNGNTCDVKRGEIVLLGANFNLITPITCSTREHT